MPKDETKPESARLDLWLWSTRLYKTRTVAADACKNNRITVNGQRGKSARQVRIGDRLEVDRGPLVQEIDIAPLGDNLSIERSIKGD